MYRDTACAPLGFALREPRRGYRFAPENLVFYDLLADDLGSEFRPLQQADAPLRIADFGAGCGVLGLLALSAHTTKGSTPAALDLVERLDEHADLCEENARRYRETAPSASAPTISVRREDLRELRRDGMRCYDLIVANPPFFAPEEGQPSRNPSTRFATHAHHGGVDSFIDAIARTLDEEGRFYLLYPADRVAEALATLPAHGLAVDELTLVFARHTGKPFRVWIRGGHAHPVSERGATTLRTMSALTPR